MRIINWYNDYKEKEKCFRLIIITIDYFNKKHPKTGKSLCRALGCVNERKYPYHYYCCQEHQEEFTSWYLSHFHWESVRTKIIKRDNYTCQHCGYKPYQDGYYYNDEGLEVDHIAPKSTIHTLNFSIYPENTIEYWIDAWLKYIGNHNNLRTLCRECHKKVTKAFHSERAVKRKKMNPSALDYYCQSNMI